MATSLAVRVAVLMTIQTAVVSSTPDESDRPCYDRRRQEKEGHDRGMVSNEYVHRNKDDIKLHKERAYVNIISTTGPAEVHNISPREQTKVNTKAHKERTEVNIKSPRERAAVDIKSPRQRPEIDIKSFREWAEVDNKSPREQAEVDNKSPRERAEVDNNSPRERSEIDNKSPRERAAIDLKSPRVIKQVSNKSPIMQKKGNGETPIMPIRAGSKSSILWKEVNRRSHRIQKGADIQSPRGQTEVNNNPPRVLPHHRYINVDDKSQGSLELPTSDFKTNRSVRSKRETEESPFTHSDDDEIVTTLNKSALSDSATTSQFSTPPLSSPTPPPLFSAQRPSAPAPPPLLSTPRSSTPAISPPFSTPRYSTPAPSPLCVSPPHGPLHLSTSSTEHNFTFHHLSDPPFPPTSELKDLPGNRELAFQLPRFSSSCLYSATQLPSIKFIYEEIVSNPSFSPLNFLRSLCPLQFCDNQVSAIDIQNPCCAVCDCTRNCSATDSCCDDKDIHGTADNQAVCTSSALLLSLYNRTTDIQTYKMVTNCSPQYTDGMFPVNYSRKCENPEEMTLENLTPVHHKETGITYRNIHCAVCNFAYGDIEQWNPRLECEQVFETYEIFYEFSNFTDIVNRAMEIKLCDIVWHPGNLDSEACFEQEDIVSACQTIGNSLVQDLCREFSAPFRYKGIVYKNVFCVVCAWHTTDDAYLNSCNDSRRNKPAGANFVANIDVAVLEAGQRAREVETMYDQRNNSCRRGFEMNDHIMACVRKTCPTSMLNVSGVCQPVLDKMSGVGFEFLLTLGYPGFIPSDAEIKSDGRQFLPDNLMTCAEELGKPWIKNGTVYIIYYQIMYNRSLINIHDLYMDFDQQVRAYSDDKFTVDIGGMAYSVNIIDYMGHIWYENTFMNGCSSSIAMSELQFCDAILIDSQDYVIKDGTMIINGFKFQPSDFVLVSTLAHLYSFDNTQYIQICVDRLNEVILQMYDVTVGDYDLEEEISGSRISATAAIRCSAMAAMAWVTAVNVSKL